MSSTGAIIMGVFAAVWWLVGVRWAGYGSPLIYGIPLAVTALIILAALRSRDRFGQASPEEHARRDRLVIIASAVEGLAIFVAINVLGNVGEIDYAAPVVAIIVGLHFLPLAQRLPARLYYGTGALLVALGVCGFVIRHPAPRLIIVSVGAACILWLTSAVVLASARRSRYHERDVPAA
jgi:hypothetical protein